MKYNYLIMAMALLPVSLIISGQQISDNKTLRKSFPAGDYVALEVTNKYGDVHITHSHNDSVTVSVEVTASSNTGEKLNAMMSDVEINLTMSNETVRAATTFNKGTTPLFESFKGLTKNLINFDSRLKIDYFIECPPRTVLRVTNSYGDVYIGDETPELTLKLSNGNLDAAVVKNAQMMELIFCKANIKSIENGKVSLSFSELRSKEAGNIKLTSVSSKIWIEHCGTLDIDSKRDDMNFGIVKIMTGICYFSDIITDNITGEITMSAKYGNLSFENIDPDFSLIDIQSSYADIDIAMSEKTSYNLEIRQTNAFVSLPGFTPEPERTEISEQDKIYLTRAEVGRSPARARVRIDATRGEVRLLQK